MPVLLLEKAGFSRAIPLCIELITKTGGALTGDDCRDGMKCSFPVNAH